MALLEEANVVLGKSRRIKMKIQSDKEKLELWRLELRKDIRLRVLPPPTLKHFTTQAFSLLLMTTPQLN